MIEYSTQLNEWKMRFKHDPALKDMLRIFINYHITNHKSQYDRHMDVLLNNDAGRNPAQRSFGAMECLKTMMEDWRYESTKTSGT